LFRIRTATLEEELEDSFLDFFASFLDDFLLCVEDFFFSNLLFSLVEEGFALYLSPDGDSDLVACLDALFLSLEMRGW